MKKIIIVSILALSSSCVWADAYIGAGLGQSNLSSGDSGNVSVHQSTASLLYGGYKFNKHIGAELGCAYLKGTARVNNSDNTYYSADVTTHAVYATAVAYAPLADNFNLDLKLGLSTVAKSARAPYEYDRMGVMVGAGGELKFNDRFGMALEYDRLSKQTGLFALIGIFHF